MNDPCADFKPLVLIAQHNERDRNLIVEASLKCDKYDVVTASSGQEIIDRVNETCFDAAVIGLKFPDLTGSTLAYLIHEFDPYIKIGFLTIYNTVTLSNAIKDLDGTFLDKTEEMKDLNGLCDKIYKLATEIPCTDKVRVLGRKLGELDRKRYRAYDKLSIPDFMQITGRSAYGR